MSLKMRNKPSTEFSMASIADLVFLLLIFFMLTSSFVSQSGIKVELPNSSSEKPSEGKNTVTVSKDGVYAWNDKTVDKEEIPNFIIEVLTDDDKSNNLVTLVTDKETKMQDVAFVMSYVAEYKGKIVIATEKE